MAAGLRYGVPAASPVTVPSNAAIPKPGGAARDPHRVDRARARPGRRRRPAAAHAEAARQRPGGRPAHLRLTVSTLKPPGATVLTAFWQLSACAPGTVAEQSQFARRDAADRRQPARQRPAARRSDRRAAGRRGASVRRSARRTCGSRPAPPSCWRRRRGARRAPAAGPRTPKPARARARAAAPRRAAHASRAPPPPARRAPRLRPPLPLHAAHLPVHAAAARTRACSASAPRARSRAGAAAPPPGSRPRRSPGSPTPRPAAAAARAPGRRRPSSRRRSSAGRRTRRPRARRRGRRTRPMSQPTSRSRVRKKTSSPLALASRNQESALSRPLEISCTVPLGTSYSYASTRPLTSSRTSGCAVLKKARRPSSLSAWLRCQVVCAAPAPVRTFRNAFAVGETPAGGHEAHTTSGASGAERVGAVEVELRAPPAARAVRVSRAAAVVGLRREAAAVGGLEQQLAPVGRHARHVRAGAPPEPRVVVRVRVVERDRPPRTTASRLASPSSCHR